MSNDDDRQTSEATDLLAPAEAAPPALVEPDMLVEGLRYLQQRIPDFTHLSTQEKRSQARAANLDPEFIEHGLHAAGVWQHTETVLRRSADDLRQEDDQIRHWDKVIVEARALLDGIEAANLKRKYSLGVDILKLYRMLAITFRHVRPEDEYMRPYYENMKRAYLRTQKFHGRKKKKEPETP